MRTIIHYLLSLYMTAERTARWLDEAHGYQIWRNK